MSASDTLERMGASTATEVPSGDEASWIESHASGSVTPDPQLDAIAIARVFGRTFAQGCPSDVEWRMTLFPGDAARAVKRRESHHRYDMTYRIVLPDGGSRRVRDRLRRLGEHASLRIVTVLGESAPVERGAAFAPSSFASIGDTSADAPWIDRALDEAILRCDAARRIVEVLGPAELLPMSKLVLLGMPVHDVVGFAPEAGTAWTAAVDRACDTQRPQICAYSLDRDGAEQRCEARVLPLPDGGVVLAIRDVSERDRLREKLEAVAMHDLLTGLPNLRALRETLVRWMKPSADDAAVVLALVDLDRFKQTVDLAGRSIGDALLRIVAQRLQRALLAHLRASRIASASLAHASAADLKERLVVARIGGDQFAVALRHDAHAGHDADLLRDHLRADATALAARILATTSEPARLAGQLLFARACVGLAVHPFDARDASTLFSHAEAALLRAKRNGRNQARRHGDDDVGDDVEPGSTDPDERALRDALSAEDFVLVYQPKFDLATSQIVQDGDGGSDGSEVAPVPGEIVAVEALLRWKRAGDAQSDWLIPQRFLPLAESSGVIRPLGEWVVRTAIGEVARYARARGVAPSLAVNVSMTQLVDRAFVDAVAVALAANDWPAERLVLELAETALVEDVRLVADALDELSASGVKLAIDHFGVGTAGLVALRALPIDEIKIDRRFVAAARDEPADAAIVEGLTAMAHRLGMRVTAEGVEDAGQVATLAALGCDALQGFFVGEPMVAHALFADDRLWVGTPHDRGDGEAIT